MFLLHLAVGNKESEACWVEFFSGVLENNLEAAQRANEMLVPRFRREQE